MKRLHMVVWTAAVALGPGSLVGCDGAGSGNGDDGSSSTGPDMMTSSTTGGASDSGSGSTSGPGSSSSDTGRYTTSGSGTDGTTGSSSSSGGDTSSGSGSESGSESSSSSSTTGGQELVELSNHEGTCTPEHIYPCDGEEDHWVAARLAPDETPFTVQAVTYGLVEGSFGGRDCASTLEHELQVYAMDAAAAVPPATPDVLFESSVVPHPEAAPEGGGILLFEAELDTPIVLEEGEHLVIAIQNAGDVSGPGCAASGTSTCVATCAGSGFESDENFWSNAATPAYPWATLASFGIVHGPNVTAIGYAG